MPCGVEPHRRACNYVVCCRARAGHGEHGDCAAAVEEAIVWILIILVIAAIAYGRWRMSLRRWPYEPCRRCGGSSRNPGSSAQRFGKCPNCDGTGRKLRRGARR